MELRDFAEQILSATSLEEKLRCPEIITDERPGAPIEAPEAPGRPLELRFKGPSSAKADFPGLHGLEQERERGRLLHFFGNHELLATELMALALLRFPEAPAMFRQGVLRAALPRPDETMRVLRLSSLVCPGFSLVPLGRSGLHPVFGIDSQTFGDPVDVIEIADDLDRDGDLFIGETLLAKRVTFGIRTEPPACFKIGLTGCRVGEATVQTGEVDDTARALLPETNGVGDFVRRLHKLRRNASQKPRVMPMAPICSRFPAVNLPRRRDGLLLASWPPSEASFSRQTGWLQFLWPADQASIDRPPPGSIRRCREPKPSPSANDRFPPDAWIWRWAATG
jgi:hypothetical protein